MNAIEINTFEMTPVEMTPIELYPPQIDALVDIWNKYSEHIPDDIFCEENGYCFVTYYVLLMKIIECGSELSDPKERHHFISLVKTLKDIIRKRKEGEFLDYVFITDLYYDIHTWYNMDVSLV